MKFTYFIIIIILFLTLPLKLSAQEKDSTENNSLNLYAYPIAFYSPESNLALGALGILSFHLSEKPNSKPSKIEVYGYYTLNTQFSFSSKPEVYFDDDKFYLSSYLNYSKVIDKYYGVGSNSINIDDPSYESRSSLIFLKFQRQIVNNINAGLIYEFRNYRIVDVKKNPYLQSGLVFGGNGGITSGLGIVASYDSRNNIYYPESGGLYEIASIYFVKNLGSDYSYTRTSIDLRKFNKITDEQVLAIQFFYNFINGSAPFYSIPPLGGETILRGYFTGRYRDRHHFAAQVEYRLRVWWKFGLVAFAGLGDVAQKFSLFTLKHLKFSYGAGVRFRFDDEELLDLRADVGFGRNTSGFYFSLNQAF